MSEELKLKFLALGLLSASAIGGEACKDCPHNIPRMSAALLTGDGEALRDCAKLLFKDCELVPGGTKARIAELEAERDRLREVVEKLVWLYSDEHQERLDNELRIDGFYSHEWLGMILDMAREAMKGAEE